MKVWSFDYVMTVNGTLRDAELDGALETGALQTALSALPTIGGLK